jgi:hypothetical protein
MFIDFGLQIVYQSRCLLDLVEDGTLPVFHQKSPWIILGELAEIQGFQRYIGLIRKGGSTQRGFSCLSGAGHCHNGIICGELHQPVSEFSSNHGAYDSGLCIDCQSRLQSM